MGAGLLTLSSFSSGFIDRLRARFEAKLTPEPNTGCWLWTGAQNSGGYGCLGVGSRGHSKAIVRAAHRVAWLLDRGEVADGLVLDHLCRNRLCVNPAHLEPVTHLTNVLRGAGHAAVNARKRVCNQGHPLSGANLRVSPDGRRRTCVKCQVDGKRERRRKAREAARQVREAA